MESQNVNPKPEQAFELLKFLKKQNDYWNVNKHNVLYGNGKDWTNRLECIGATFKKWTPENYRPYQLQKEVLNGIYQRYTKIGKATKRGWQFQRALFRLTYNQYQICKYLKFKGEEWVSIQKSIISQNNWFKNHDKTNKYAKQSQPIRQFHRRFSVERPTSRRD